MQTQWRHYRTAGRIVPDDRDRESVLPHATAACPSSPRVTRLIEVLALPAGQRR